jgi:hypothetical protein
MRTIQDIIDEIGAEPGFVIVLRILESEIEKQTPEQLERLIESRAKVARISMSNVVEAWRHERKNPN